jgi:hypothetical protein
MLMSMSTTKQIAILTLDDVFDISHVARNTHGSFSTTFNGEFKLALEFTPGFQWGSCYSTFSLMCMFCR